MPEGVDEGSVAGVDGASVVVDRCSVGVEACLVVMVVVVVLIVVVMMVRVVVVVVMILDADVGDNDAIVNTFPVPGPMIVERSEEPRRVFSEAPTLDLSSPPFSLRIGQIGGMDI